LRTLCESNLINSLPWDLFCDGPKIVLNEGITIPETRHINSFLIIRFVSSSRVCYESERLQPPCQGTFYDWHLTMLVFVWNYCVVEFYCLPSEK